MKQYLKARAVDGALGYTSQGKEQVAVQFEITQGERAGQRLTWFGFFSDLTAERTIESLRHCGWQGDNLADLSGIETNEVEIVTDEEEYQGTVKEKIQWVNRGGGVQMRDRMSGDAAAAFAAKMRGFVVQQKQKSGAPVPTPPKSGTAPRGGAPAAPPARGTGTYGGAGGGPPARQPGDDADEIPFIVDMTMARSDVP